MPELTRFAADHGWSVHVPWHPAEVRRTLLQAVRDGERAYVHGSAGSDAEPRAAAEGFARAWDHRRRY
ncbi:MULTISPECIES: hypothetical protein [unclassified Streptomyces]|uniref:hypothetical protein n=1 Tax=unclassified Streptomyces TaxID=2593676 RepID=UPI002251CFA5|nr:MULTISPECIES: hypothetical protein [unclassified Streptomyces]MCX4878403.1 hypothetical protein [Streptomyces sp. NBC_00847]MCX5418417.1 hypothetical protein [Streptomyces sp. NBC_00078]